MENKYRCHDCKKAIKLDGKKIINGVQLVYADGGEKIEIIKCQSCYKKNQGLANYKKCEVYSRVVGYIRPVQQWHIGKKEEFKDRENYRA
jgi:ribonucleoside-triphosphate reductase